MRLYFAHLTVPRGGCVYAQPAIGPFKHIYISTVAMIVHQYVMHVRDLRVERQTYRPRMRASTPFGNNQRSVDARARVFDTSGASSSYNLYCTIETERVLDFV